MEVITQFVDGGGYLSGVSLEAEECRQCAEKRSRPLLMIMLRVNHGKLVIEDRVEEEAEPAGYFKVR